MGFKPRRLEVKAPEYSCLFCPKCDTVWEQYEVESMDLIAGDIIVCPYDQVDLLVKESIGGLYLVVAEDGREES